MMLRVTGQRSPPDRDQRLIFFCQNVYSFVSVLGVPQSYLAIHMCVCVCVCVCVFIYILFYSFPLWFITIILWSVLIILNMIFCSGDGLVTNSCLTFVTPLTIAHPAPFSMAFPRQEYWTELPFPSPGVLLNPGIKPGSPSPPLQVDSFTDWAPREAWFPVLDRKSLLFILCMVVCVC